jgi:3-hydroxybutyryl-CoA dehydratase
MSQSLRFRKPVRIGDTVTATVEITELNAEKHRVSLSTVCRVKGESVLEGEALVTVPSRASKAAKEAAE